MTTTRKPATVETLKVGDKVYKGNGKQVWTVTFISGTDCQLASERTANRWHHGMTGNWIAIDTLTVEGE